MRKALSLCAALSLVAILACSLNSYAGAQEEEQHTLSGEFRTHGNFHSRFR